MVVGHGSIRMPLPDGPTSNVRCSAAGAAVLPLPWPSLQWGSDLPLELRIPRRSAGQFCVLAEKSTSPQWTDSFRIHVDYPEYVTKVLNSPDIAYARESTARSVGQYFGETNRFYRFTEKSAAEASKSSFPILRVCGRMLKTSSTRRHDGYGRG